MSRSHEMVGVMNNTKWEELRLAMYELGPLHPQFSVKDLEREEMSAWDGEWFYHFRLGEYKCIEYVDLRVRSPEARAAVHERLRAIHVPGIETKDGFRIFGWVKSGEFVDYLK